MTLGYQHLQMWRPECARVGDPGRKGSPPRAARLHHCDFKLGPSCRERFTFWALKPSVPRLLKKP